MSLVSRLVFLAVAAFASVSWATPIRYIVNRAIEEANPKKRGIYPVTHPTQEGNEVTLQTGTWLEKFNPNFWYNSPRTLNTYTIIFKDLATARVFKQLFEGEFSFEINQDFTDQGIEKKFVDLYDPEWWANDFSYDEYRIPAELIRIRPSSGDPQHRIGKDMPLVEFLFRVSSLEGSSVLGECGRLLSTLK